MDTQLTTKTRAPTIHASNVDADEFTSGSVAWSDVEFEPDLSASVALGANADNGLVKITTSTLAYTNADTDGVRAFSISGSGYDEFFPAYTKYDKDNDQIEHRKNQCH